MAAVVCPECESPLVINPDEYEEGETLACDECGANLEIKSLDPVEVATLEDAGYDDEDHSHLSQEEDE